jgi:hypothetical protein
MAPDEVAEWADAPVIECDLHAKHLWLVSQAGFRRRMMSDPDYYDARVAGYWLWGICAWIGSGWCDSKKYTDEEIYAAYLAGGEIGLPRQKLPHLGDAGQGINRPSQKLPHLGDAGQGINRLSQRLPHLGNAGKGINRPSQQLPHLGDAGQGINRPSTSAGIHAYMQALAARLRTVRVCCGDWSRVLTPSVTTHNGITGILLDPPYSHDIRDSNIYSNDQDCGAAVREWAIANGDNPMLRIALCGYSDSAFAEHDMPPGWEVYRWKAQGGMGNQGEGRGSDNSALETIWFSPACLRPSKQHSLFD